MEITYEGSPRKQIKSWLFIDWWTVKQADDGSNKPPRTGKATNHRGQAAAGRSLLTDVHQYIDSIDCVDLFFFSACLDDSILICC